jgi:hypothetical protein
MRKIVMVERWWGKNEVMCVEGWSAWCVMPPCFLLDVDFEKNWWQHLCLIRIWNFYSETIDVWIVVLSLNN